MINFDFLIFDVSHIQPFMYILFHFLKILSTNPSTDMTILANRILLNNIVYIDWFGFRLYCSDATGIDNRLSLLLTSFTKCEHTHERLTKHIINKSTISLVQKLTLRTRIKLVTIHPLDDAVVRASIMVTGVICEVFERISGVLIVLHR